MRISLGTLLFATLVAYGLGFYLPYQVSTILLLVIAGLLIRRYGLVSLPAIIYVVIVFPALSPFVAKDLVGAEYYTGFDFGLQEDILLTNKVLSLFLFAAAAFALACTNKAAPRPERLSNHTIYGRLDVVLLLSLVVLVCAYLTEPGRTLLTASYAELRQASLRQGSLHILGAQMLQLAWIFLFLLGRHKSYIFWTTTLAVMLWLFLHSRRMELIGIALCLLLWLRFRYSSRRTILVGILAFVLLSVLPVVRNASWIGGNLGSLEIGRLFFYGELTEGTRFKLPGGVPSSAFMTAMQLVNEKDRGNLTFRQSKTMISWLFHLIPSPLMDASGFAPPPLEPQSIFHAHDLPYVGGMHLLGAFYINGGAIFVILYGLINGMVSSRGERVLRKQFSTSWSVGATASMFFIYLFVVNQMRFQWYHPTPLLKLLLYGGLALLMVYSASESRRTTDHP